MGVDLGTYHVVVWLKGGDGFIFKYETGPTLAHTNDKSVSFVAW